MINFSLIVEEFRNELISLSSDLRDDIKDALLQDGLDFIEGSKADLERWSNLFAAGQLSREELEWLLRSKRDLVEMEALKQKGLALARIDRYRNAVTQSALNAVFKGIS
ncbi:hypothetical protein [Desulfonatronospira sp.]|uniref:hypothetical protein n=1 Tax=Desulfonatronospira sp. TaxID=1962951 RepID=UPI0025B86BC1|nr:hypothetical protein [Desulfonatronospira sp.]